ncbi:hypothetical protein LCGC14_2899440, partial [marine sediment metagenome]
ALYSPLTPELVEKIKSVFPNFNHLDPETGSPYRCLAHLHAERVSAYNQKVNPIFHANLADLGLTVMSSDIRNQIQVIVSELPNFFQRLAAVGIQTESLAFYPVADGDRHYGHSAVRILTPSKDQLPEVLKRIKIALELDT